MAMEVNAPMVGKVVKILVQVGQEVAEDDPVAMLEAMKVEMPIVAPGSGKVTKILVKEGDAVESEQVIAVLD